MGPRALLALADLAAEQWGLFTASQARRVGQPATALNRLTSRGVLERLEQGIYRLAGTPPDPREPLRAAWLTLDPSRTASERLQETATAVVSHQSAAVLHNLGDVAADRHEFTTATRKQSRRDHTALHRGTVSLEDWQVLDGLPVTTPLRTIVDLAKRRLDGGHLAGVVRDAITSHHLEPNVVADSLRPYAHYYRVRLGDGQALLRSLLDQAGLPRSIRQLQQYMTETQLGSHNTEVRASS